MHVLYLSDPDTYIKLKKDPTKCTEPICSRRKAALSSRTKLSVSDIIRLLRFCLNSCDFVFNAVFYHQPHGCPMDSPVSVPVANLVIEHVKNEIFSANDFNVLFWRRYVDDRWVVLPRENASPFVTFINSTEESVQFSVEYAGLPLG